MAIRLRVSVMVKNDFMSALSCVVWAGPASQVQHACQTGRAARPNALLKRSKGSSSENACVRRFNPASASCAGSIRRRVHATLAALALLTLAQPAPALQDGAVQPEIEPRAADQPPSGRDASPPAPDLAINAFNYVEQWIRTLSVPPERPIELPPIYGASISVRLGGEILVTQIRFSDDRDVLLPLIRSVVAELTEKMPYEKDIFWEQKVASAAERTTISLELCAGLVPMPEQTDIDRALATNPGIDGVAFRYNDRLEAMSPGTMLALDVTPADAINVVRAKLIDDPELKLQPERIRGATYYRFRTTHLAQVDPRSSPIFLHRGGRVVKLTDIDEAYMTVFADEMATHLLMREGRKPERLGLLGTYHPATIRYDPWFADPKSQALGAYTLLRYAGTPGVDPQIAGDARRLAANVLADLGVIERDETIPWATPIGAATAMLAITEGRRIGIDINDEAERLERESRRALWTAYSESGGFGEIPVAAYSLVACAMAVTATDQAEHALARSALQATYLQTPEDQLEAQLPWLGWAALTMAPFGDVPGAEGFRAMRDRIWRDQYMPADARPGDEDLVGGIVLTTGGLSPLPSWHTARRVAFLATMLGDDRLTEPTERGAQIVHLLRSIRFLRQLEVDDAVGHLCRSPERAKGGIRSALWDQQMPIDATSFSLLCVTEMLRSLDAL